jgi:hypothetical protein
MEKFKLPTSYGYVVVRFVVEHPDCLAAIIKICDTRVSPPQCRYARVFVTLPNIRAEVFKGFSARGLTDGVAGFDWQSLKKMARKTARKVGGERLMNVVQKVAKDASSYGSAIYAPLGVTYNAIKKANSLLQKAESGVPVAIKVLEKIRRGAEAGDDSYKKTAKLVLTLYNASKKFSIDEWLSNRVSGWGSHYDRVSSYLPPKSSGGFFGGFYRSGLR